jgi:uncharacterized protein with FMN-binding domain
MRRIVVAIMGTLSGLVLLFTYPTSTNSGANVALGTKSSAESSSGTTGPGSSSSSSSGQSSSGSSSGSSSANGSGATFTGSAVNTRWGLVQVQITVSDGKITASQAVQYPQANGRDRQINASALPILAQEVTQAQSADIDAVSGATVTSDGYIQSLQSAIDQAHL